jgi:UDPglucose 6-dehydrogenase
MKICVVGTGYVGLVTGTGFAEVGNHVVCVNVDKEKVERRLKGEIPIFEPDVEETVSRNIRQKRLLFCFGSASHHCQESCCLCRCRDAIA